jgi:hypothetical protein
MNDGRWRDSTAEGGCPPPAVLFGGVSPAATARRLRSIRRRGKPRRCCGGRRLIRRGKPRRYGAEVAPDSSARQAPALLRRSPFNSAGKPRRYGAEAGFSRVVSRRRWVG